MKTNKLMLSGAILAAIGTLTIGTTIPVAFAEEPVPPAPNTTTDSPNNSDNGAGNNGADNNGAGNNAADNNGAGNNAAGDNGAGNNGTDNNGADNNGAGNNGAGNNGAGNNGAGNNGADNNGADNNGADNNGAGESNDKDKNTSATTEKKDDDKDKDKDKDKNKKKLGKSHTLAKGGNPNHININLRSFRSDHPLLLAPASHSHDLTTDPANRKKKPAKHHLSNTGVKVNAILGFAASALASGIALLAVARKRNGR